MELETSKITETDPYSIRASSSTGRYVHCLFQLSVNQADNLLQWWIVYHYVVHVASYVAVHRPHGCSSLCCSHHRASRKIYHWMHRMRRLCLGDGTLEDLCLHRTCRMSQPLLIDYQCAVSLRIWSHSDVGIRRCRGLDAFFRLRRASSRRRREKEGRRVSPSKIPVG